MAFILSRNNAKACYYCHNIVQGASPSSPLFGGFSSSSTSGPSSNFQCPHCGCRNRFNAKGEIVGDDPAMWNERLNADSMSKRGSPDRNQLPSQLQSSNKNIFCRSCTTNQTLLINLLANYLPDDEQDPAYNSRLASLPAYTTSLQARYPPVCASCLPGVEDEIARKDTMARTRALGGALKASSSRAARQSHNTKDVLKQRRSLWVWKIRGLLWCASLLISLLLHTAGAVGFRQSSFSIYPPLSPIVALLSLLWNLWDPTYSLRQRSATRGKEIRVEGRPTFVKLQFLAWLSRFLFSCFVLYAWIYPTSNSLSSYFSTTSLHRFCLALELAIIPLSYFSIRIRKPSPIRLIDTSASRALTPMPESQPMPFLRSSTPSLSSSASSAISEPDLFATLSLSPNPVIANYAAASAINPIFGKPSLLLKSELASKDRDSNVKYNGNEVDHFYPDDEDEDAFTLKKDPNAMDWEPITSYENRQSLQTQQQHARNADDGSWLRQQRFFPPEEPTGLESLLMHTRLIDDVDVRRQQSRRSRTSANNVRWNWTWVYSLSIVPILFLILSLWWRGSLSSRPSNPPSPHQV